MLLTTVAEVWRAVADTRSRNEKRDRLAALLRDAGTRRASLLVSWLAGELPQGRIGVGPALVREVLDVPAVDGAPPTVDETDRTFATIGEVSGKGSKAERARLLGGLLARCDPHTRHFVARLLVGELRQGALESVMLDAIAVATETDAASVRRAMMLSGGLTLVARAAFDGGQTAIDAFRLELFRPLQPMLAQTAESVDDLHLDSADAAPLALEYKLDGARIQVHKEGDEIRVYTRNLHDVTRSLPEVVERIRAVGASSLVLDGEVLALRPDGSPHRFQTTMRRFGRRVDVAAMRQKLPLTPVFFDVLHVDGDTVLDAPSSRRSDLMANTLGSELCVPTTIVERTADAVAFAARALDAGHEGVMAKALDAPYLAGKRGGAWLKLKPVHTLDLVILAAEWGSGRRRGTLSNLHLGARDAAGAFETPFVMLGKTFKGLSDDMLRWQTEHLQSIEVRRTKRTVWVEPSLVVEIAFDAVQKSPKYPAGMALRFARVKHFRPDKPAAEADTVATVRRIFDGELAARFA